MLSPEIKTFLNNLKCPICKAQIDFIDVKSASYACNLGCAHNNDHYMLKLEDFFDLPIVTHEILHIYDQKSKYKIIKLYSGPQIETVIKVYNIDPEGREVFSFKEKKLEFKFDAFDFSKFNREKALNRIKNLFLFT